MRKKKRGAGAGDLERACEEQMLKKQLTQKPSLQYMDPRKQDAKFLARAYHAHRDYDLKITPNPALPVSKLPPAEGVAWLRRERKTPEAIDARPEQSWDS